MNLKKRLFLTLAKLPIPRQKRWWFAEKAGVKFASYGDINIGKNVSIDGMLPQNIELSRGVHIADNCVLLTHYVDTSRKGLYFISGKIKIGERAFIGMNTIICRPVTIGEYAIIGAGSVVTKDIPAYEIWAGNPARFIKRQPQIQ